jgi:hypothetical protein
MSIKKYKTLKINSTLLNLNNIFQKSIFIVFFQIKHLNFKDWSVLKKEIFLSDLKVFSCKNTFLKKKLLSLNIPLNLYNNIPLGNILIVYSMKLVTSKNIEFFNKKFNILFLFSYTYQKIMFLKTFIKFLNKNKLNVFIELLDILETHNKNIFYRLLLSNKNIVDVINCRYE